MAQHAAERERDNGGNNLKKRNRDGPVRAVPDVSHQDRKEINMENNPDIIIGGRTIPLFYSVYETVAIQREIGCTAFQLNEQVFGVEKIDEEKDAKLNNIRLTVAKDPEKMEKLGKLITILGNAGLEENGQEADLTAKWVLRHMKPAMVTLYGIAIMTVIAEGNMMEAKREQTGRVDEIKEEIDAKKQQRD